MHPNHVPFRPQLCAVTLLTNRLVPSCTDDVPVRPSRLGPEALRLAGPAPRPPTRPHLISSQALPSTGEDGLAPLSLSSRSRVVLCRSLLAHLPPLSSSLRSPLCSPLPRRRPIASHRISCPRPLRRSPSPVRRGPSRPWPLAPLRESWVSGCLDVRVSGCPAARVPAARRSPIAILLPTHAHFPCPFPFPFPRPDPTRPLPLPLTARVVRRDVTSAVRHSPSHRIPDLPDLSSSI